MVEKAVTLEIRGRVQGVGYRQWMVDEARARGLHGWVRNRADGRVEAVVAGPAATVDALIAACRTGPPTAAVVSVDVSAAEPTEESTQLAARTFVARGTL